MAGTTLMIQPKTDYVMQASQFAAGKSMQVVAARRIPVERWREGILLARVHAVSNWKAGAIITLNWALDPFTQEDPALVWQVPQQTPIIFKHGTDTPPVAKTQALAAPFGPLIMLE